MTDPVRATLDALTLEEKARLLAGGGMWHTVGIDRLGVPAVEVTDGPRGARGADGNHGPASTSFPAGVAMGATWDPSLIEELGRSLATETAAMGAQILLGPTVNIPRIPNAGRNFECFSEDPLLSGLLAAAWVRGIQSRGVGACIKHFVCNDQEHDRYEIDAVVAERPLREIYLEPFRIAIEDAGPWSVMSAYNAINGQTASEHPMLEGILRTEFGFDGLVMSDWYGTYGPGVIGSGLDLEMPGPARWMDPDAVLRAIEDGVVAEGDIDRKVARLLTLIERTEPVRRRATAERAAERPEDRALARRVAAESIVLLANDGLLPLAAPARIALIGELAAETPHQGGGSSSVNPHRVVSVLDGIRSRAGDDTEVTWTPGCRVRRSAAAIDADAIAGAGFLVEYFRGGRPSGEPVRSVVSTRSFLAFFGTGDGVVDYDGFSVKVSGRFVARHRGRHLFEFTAGGRLRVRIDGDVVVDHWQEPAGGAVRVDRDLDSGEELGIEIEYASLPGERWRWLGLGCDPPGSEPSIDAAAEAASQADVAIVVVGLTPEWESEGWDRPDLVLPGDQDALLGAVTAVQPNTVVVVTAGAPVEMPWCSDAAAVVQAWYGGQEIGHALADVLFGDVDPGGRLPVTFPRDSRQHPGLLNYPGEGGRVRYGEGVFVGYRGFDKLGLEPRFRFGHGLSYTAFEAGPIACAPSPDGVMVEIGLSNVGTRDGTEVVQGYLLGVGGVDRKLVGFRKVRLAAGASSTVRLEIPIARLRWWDPEVGDWCPPSGEIVFEISGSFGTGFCSLELGSTQAK